jgi:hypothetical protein
LLHHPCGCEQACAYPKRERESPVLQHGITTSDGSLSPLFLFVAAFYRHFFWFIAAFSFSCGDKAIIIPRRGPFFNRLLRRVWLLRRGFCGVAAYYDVYHNLSQFHKMFIGKARKLCYNTHTTT